MAWQYSGCCLDVHTYLSGTICYLCLGSLIKHLENLRRNLHFVWVREFDSLHRCAPHGAPSPILVAILVGALGRESIN